MTEQEITDLGPAFAAYLRRFRGHFGQDRTAAHFDTYCHGLLSDLPRKTIEPVALAAGTAVRTLRSSWSPHGGTTRPTTRRPTAPKRSSSTRRAYTRT